MDQLTATSDAGYSPNLFGELTIHGERFTLAASGPDGLVLRSPRALGPGRGTVRIIVDGRATVYDVDLWRGIDPSVRQQPFRMVKTVAEVVG